jgi:hypothetical protein
MMALSYHVAVGLAVSDLRPYSYGGYRFPPDIIQQAIWLYVRFTLSFRDVEDLLAERGIMISYETVRRWVNHFGPMVAVDLRKRPTQTPYDLAPGRSLSEYFGKGVCTRGIPRKRRPVPGLFPGLTGRLYFPREAPRLRRIGEMRSPRFA